MRILHIGAANSLTGGGEKHIADLMTALVARGHDVSLAAPEGGDLKRIALEHGIAYFPVEIGSGFSFGRLARIRDIIEEFQPDIIHAHGHRAALFARMSDPRAAKRVVYTLHGIHVDSGLLSPLKMQNERILYKKTAYFVVTCQQDFDKAINLGIANPAKLALVYNGVSEKISMGTRTGEFRRELGIDDGTLLILHIGRLDIPKNQKMLVDAISLAKPDITTSFRLVMVAPGEEPSREKLNKYIASKGLVSDILVLPGRLNLEPVYHDSDIFVLSSKWEATPYVMIEAMMAGLAVASTAVGGIPEVISHGVNGLLSPTEDALLLSRSLVALANDPGARDKLGAAAKATAKDRASIKTMTMQLEEVYRKVLEAAS